tara:strand:+ start:4106 stop:4750 length:645 start_codon:yes stop_codon:yes gene_type:complete
VKKSSKISKRGFIILVIAGVLQFGSLAIQQYVVQAEGNIRDMQESIPELNNKFQNIQSSYFSLTSLNSEYLESIQMSINFGLYSDNLLSNLKFYTSSFMEIVISNSYVKEFIDQTSINNFRNLKKNIEAIDVKDLNSYSLFEVYLYEIMNFYRVLRKEAGATLGEIDNLNIEINNANNKKQIYLLFSIVLEILSFLLILIFFRLFIQKNIFKKI